MTKLIWRLGKLPTPTEIVELMSKGVISKEEGREILFNTETEEDRDKKSLESEIKFLRELVEKLASGDQAKIVKIIEKVYDPYHHNHWYNPYQQWCNTLVGASTDSSYQATLGGATLYSASGRNETVFSGKGTNLGVAGTQPSASNFSDIKTF